MTAKRRKSATAVEDRPPMEPPSSARWPGVSILVDDCGGKYYYDSETAQKAVDFFPAFLRHKDGEFAGRPFVLEDWQSELIIKPLFGWKRVADGRRRFRKAYLEIPKKNGKTQLDAGIALYIAYCDEEPGAEIMIAAADRDQAALLFDAAKAMVEDAQILLQMAELYRRSIYLPETRTSIKVVSADARTKHGPNLHCVIVDELHAQPDRDLVDTLVAGVAARRQPLVIFLTTAGDDPESICREEHDYAASVIRGDWADEQLLPVIFAPGEKDDWKLPATWAKVNPNLGKTVKLDYLEAACLEAQREPRKQNAFKRLHCNIWPDQHHVWIPLEAWDACAGAVSDPSVPASAVAAGMDLSSKIDLTCLAVLRRFKDAQAPLAVELLVHDPDDETADPERVTLNVDFRIEVDVYFWRPEATLQLAVERDKVRYDVWRDDQLLRVTPGPVVDYDKIYEDIRDEIGPAFRLKQGEIGYDPYNGTQFALQLRDKAGFSVVEVPQTVRHLSEPAKLLEALVLAKRITHNGHRILRWNVGNAAVREDKNGNIFPFKPSARKRIDGVSAMLDALNRLIVMPDLKKKRRPAKVWTPNGFVTADPMSREQPHA